MSAQSLLSSVFSCSSPAAAAPAKSLSKRRLRQTRSLDPAIIGGGREDGEGAGRAPRARAAGSPPGERRGPRGAPGPHGASFSTPCTPLERSPPGSALFDEESLRGKRSPGCELPFLARTPSALALSGTAGPANSIFTSPRRWLQQRKGQPSPPEPRPAAYVVWKSEGDRGKSDLDGLLEFSSAESKVMRLSALFEYSSSKTFGYAVTELS